MDKYCIPAVPTDCALALYGFPSVFGKQNGFHFPECTCNKIRINQSGVACMHKNSCVTPCWYKD